MSYRYKYLVQIASFIRREGGGNLSSAEIQDREKAREGRDEKLYLRYAASKRPFSWLALVIYFLQGTVFSPPSLIVPLDERIAWWAKVHPFLGWIVESFISVTYPTNPSNFIPRPTTLSKGNVRYSKNYSFFYTQILKKPLLIHRHMFKIQS